MNQRQMLLLVDTGASPMEDLSGRLRLLGYRALRVKTLDQGLAALADPRFAVGAVLVPPDLPALDLERALLGFRGAEPEGAPPLLAVGQRPDVDHRARMRHAGVTYALWRPVDDHTLRFQVNRALARGGPEISTRRAERVPTNWPVRLGLGGREKPARVYSLSARGAFFATPRPSLPKALVHVLLPLPARDVRISGKVVMTNVPGNLEKRNLPAGMGVLFTGHDLEAEQAILEYTRARAELLRV